jgi:hypothetical protein
MAGPEPLNLKCLQSEVADFFAPPPPEARDSEIFSLLEQARGSGRLGELVERVRPGRESARLSDFAGLTASLAVRRENPDVLRAGLVAVGIASITTDDIRDEIGVLALLWHSARRLGLDAAAEFRAAATAIPPASDFYAEWVNRSPRLQRLSEMGFRESSDEDGFCYVGDDDLPPIGWAAVRSRLFEARSRFLGWIRVVRAGGDSS